MCSQTVHTKFIKAHFVHMYTVHKGHTLSSPAPHKCHFPQHTAEHAQNLAARRRARYPEEQNINISMLNGCIPHSGKLTYETTQRKHDNPPKAHLCCSPHRTVHISYSDVYSHPLPLPPTTTRTCTRTTHQICLVHQLDIVLPVQKQSLRLAYARANGCVPGSTSHLQAQMAKGSA